MSFDDLVALTSKADRMFGLDQNTSSVRAQKQGWLARRRGVLGISKKQWFVVKDSFLLWYDNEPRGGEVEFDFKPRGVLPLSNSLVTLPAADTVQIRLPVHKSADALLVLKAADHFEAQEWFDAIKAGMMATFENAAVGVALTEKLRNKGGEVEKEKEEALLRAQNEANRLEHERNEARKLAQLKDDEAHMHNLEVGRVADKVDELQSKISQHSTVLQTEREETEAQHKRREQLERSAAEAQEALHEIEAAFEAFEQARRRRRAKQVDNDDNKGKHDQDQVRKNVKALRSYFEALILASAQKH